MTRADLLKLADRAQGMAGAAHQRGDFLAAARLAATARRYRSAAYGA